MHFNILASNKTNETFHEIVTKAQSATEKFENQQIEQLSIWFYQDWKSRLIHYVKTGVSWVTEYNTILTSFFAFLYLVLVGDVSSLVNGKSKDIFLNMVTYSLALIALFNTIFRVKQKNDIHKQIKPYQIRLGYAYGKEEPIRRLSTWIEKQSVLQKAHPIAVLMVSLYILKQAGHEEG
ncbi:hypothetical protein [Domibacillus robiginosus]|uniref:hypothetical protein n=1 Tax=Domibacillus robiginosus TaxID=1071054 RepID=UPI00067B2D07|nr:hypothetical protein [Domibacillus robiginosus]